MNNLSFDPIQAELVQRSTVGVQGYFPDHQLNLLDNYCRGLPLTAAETFSAEGSDSRSSRVALVARDETNEPIFHSLYQLTTDINNDGFRYDLSGFKYFQYTEYSADSNDHYGWHTDVFYNEVPQDILQRKISFTLVLSEASDFEGGELEFSIGGDKENYTVEQQRGNIIAFPSFIRHRVRPVTKGVRRSLVWWALGPRFK